MDRLPVFLTEREDVWQKLMQAKKPILLYGMGDGAEKILAVFAQYGIRCDGIFASDGFVRGHSFHGFRVLSYSDACARFGDFIIVLAFAVFRKEMLSWLDTLSERHELYAPDVPVVGEHLFNQEFCQKHGGKLEAVYQLLADTASKRTFADVINFKLSGKTAYLRRCETAPEEVYTDLLKPQPNEIYMDLGAYTGDTVGEFIHFAPDYQRIIAVEPDSKNYKKLQRYLTENEILNVETIPGGIWTCKTICRFEKRAGRNSSLSGSGTVEVPVDSIDGLLREGPVTWIKMDVEGAEQQAILGGRKTLQRFAPKLNVAVYHRSEDIFALPLLIREIQPGYQLFLRHHPYIPAWETNLYCKV